jgi:hypothetical protein
MMNPPTAKDVTVQLYWAMRSASQILVPRYTPRDWWECDLWRLTSADFVDEYEIKMSVADYRADFKKQYEQSRNWNRELKQWDQIEVRNKHAFLAGDERGPNRFWFVVPSEIEDKIEVPPYAGLMVFRHSRPFVKIQAPKRHGRKWDGDKLALFSTFYHRYWNHEAKSKADLSRSCEPIADLDASPSLMEQRVALWCRTHNCEADNTESCESAWARQGIKGGIMLPCKIG